MMGLAGAQVWLVALVLWLASVAGGYWAGDHNRQNACLAQQATLELAANNALREAATRAQAAQQKYIDSSAALHASYATLEGKFNALIARGPLVVFREKAVGDGGAGAAGAVGAGAGTAGAAGVGAGAGLELAGTAGNAGAAGGAGVGLSLGAVWVWNSALAGGDVPAGACGAVDSASAACAADSGLGLEAAWANHAANAQSCAADRLRQQQLIDYLTTPKATP